MALIYIDDLVEGMVLAEDLFTPTGRFVLAAGAPLQANQLKVFKTWGIIEVDIDALSLGEEYEQDQELNAKFVERAESYMWRRFVMNDIDSEPLATIYRHVVHRLALSLQGGLDPVVFAAVALPASADDSLQPHRCA